MAANSKWNRPSIFMGLIMAVMAVVSLFHEYPLEVFGYGGYAVGLLTERLASGKTRGVTWGGLIVGTVGFVLIIMQRLGIAFGY